ncbi:hypothetical protein [Bacillus sp. JJ1764]
MSSSDSFKERVETIGGDQGRGVSGTKVLKPRLARYSLTVTTWKR